MSNLSYPSGSDKIKVTANHSFGAIQRRMAGHKEMVCWEAVIDTEVFPWLKDYRLHGKCIFPAACCLEYISSAIVNIFPENNWHIEQLKLTEPLWIKSAATSVQLIFTTEQHNIILFEFFSMSENAPGKSVLHAEGRIQLSYKSKVQPPAADIKSAWETFSEEIPAATFYAYFNQAGLQTGAAFRLACSCRKNAQEAMVHMIIGADATTYSREYTIPPAILDTCLHAAIWPVEYENDRFSYLLPVRMDRYQLFSKTIVTDDLWIRYSNIVREDESTWSLQVCVYNNMGQQLVSIDKVYFEKHSDRQQPSIADSFYELQLKEVTREILQGAVAEIRNTCWLIINNTPETQYIVDYLNRSMANVDVLPDISQPPDRMTENTAWFSFDRSAIHPAAISLSELLKRKGNAYTGIVCLINTIDGNTEEPATLCSDKCMELISLVQALRKSEHRHSFRLHVIFRGTQQPENITTDALWQAPLNGLARTISREYPELDCQLIDLPAAATPEQFGQLCRIITGKHTAKEYIIHGNMVSIYRLQKVSIAAENNIAQKQISWKPSIAFRFVTTRPGLLNSIVARQVDAPPPGAKEVEVKVQAAGLSYFNVLAALGLYESGQNRQMSLGEEFAGVVTRIGTGVTRFKKGDSVMGLDVSDSPGKALLFNESVLARIPDEITVTEAATIPGAYLTIYLAFIKYGRLNQGERVLIHSATGGVGLAAIHMAKMLGAEIYATAGTAEKRQLLRSMGIKYVCDSRSLDFAAEINRWTNNEGVDLVLNTLTGDALIEGLKLLRLHGRFCDISKKDIFGNSRLEMKHFKKGISYIFIDLMKIGRENPGLIGEMLEAFLEYWRVGSLKPLPETVFPASRIQDGFNLMLRSKHTGKIVFDMEDPALPVEPLPPPLFTADETFMVTGGTEKLGLMTARWLCRNGARQLVLISNRDADASTMEIITGMRADGCEVVVRLCDISDCNSLKHLLEELNKTMPPLSGIFLASYEWEEGMTASLQKNDFYMPFRETVNSGWYLHTLTLGERLKYFISFSGIAGMLGTPGMAGAAAAAGFFDALMVLRQQQRKPGLNINLGLLEDMNSTETQKAAAKRLQQDGVMSFPGTVFEDLMIAVINCSRHTIGAAWLDRSPDRA
ncbi:KR domain-containing protein [Chitinophaga solisilvae]|uniref:KR domain-containing protein n=1 Tax=Chitinophaga solisilvae TaxID=1233460 RepID=UPI00136AEBDF|nr:KR domain-containing protein [Chitinophaga solisilvae]